MPDIELRNVSYRAGGRAIVEEISWRLGPGEHWAVLGPNGSGKTTVLRLACGYLWPNAGGEILRDGRRLTDLRTLRRRIGWVSSLLTARIPPRERALDTVVSGRFGETGLKWLGRDVPDADDYQAAADMLTQLAAAELAEKPFGVLSQGEQQKVLIARALMPQPELLVLDEPCAGLDPGAREALLAAIGELARGPSGPAIVLVTHHLEEVLPVFDGLLILQSGRLAHCGPPAEVIRVERIEALYGAAIDELIHRHGRVYPIWANATKR